MFCFARFCIICLNNTKNLNNLDVNIVLSDGNISLFQILMDIHAELLNIHDIVPKYICTPCKKDLITTYKFHKKCRKSIDNLNDYMFKLNHLQAPAKNPETNKSYTFGYNSTTSRHMLFKIKKLTTRNYKTRKTKTKKKSITASSHLSSSITSNHTISVSDQTKVILEQPDNLNLKNTIDKLAKYLNITDLHQLDQNNLDHNNLELSCVETTAENLNQDDLLDLDQEFFEVFNVTDDDFVKEENPLDLGSCDWSDISSSSNIEYLIRSKNDIKNENPKLEPDSIKTKKSNNNYIDLTDSVIRSKNIRSNENYIDLTQSLEKCSKNLDLDLSGSNNSLNDSNLCYYEDISNESLDKINSEILNNNSFELNIKQELIDSNNPESSDHLEPINLDLNSSKNSELDIEEHPLKFEPDEMEEIKIEIQEILEKHEADASKNNKRKLDPKESKKENDPKRFKKIVHATKVPDLASFSSKIVANAQYVYSKKINDPKIEPNDPNIKEVPDLAANCTSGNVNDPGILQEPNDPTAKIICDINFLSTNIKEPNLPYSKDPNLEPNDPNVPYSKELNLEPNDPKSKDPNVPKSKDPNLEPNDPNVRKSKDPNLEPNDPNVPKPKDPNDVNVPKTSGICVEVKSNKDPNIQDPKDPKSKILEFKETNSTKLCNIDKESIVKTKDPNDPKIQDPNDPKPTNTINTELSEIGPNDPNLEPNDPSTSKEPQIFTPHTCRFCPRAFVTGIQLKCHIYEKHNNKFNECAECRKTFSNHHKLTRHIQNVHGAFRRAAHFRNADNFRTKVPFYCNICFKKFFSPFNLNKHYHLDHYQ